MARIWNIITGSNGGRPPCDVRIDERRVEFRPERPEIHRDPKGLELVAEVAYPLPPIIDIKKKPGWPRSESSPLRPPRWNQKCSNLARFLEPSTLPIETRTQILSLLCEGSSMRSISRVCDVSINTVSKLLEDAGEFCAAFHDEHVRDVVAKRIQCDEIWAFTHCKEKKVATAKAPPPDAGDTWTWTGICADSKLIVSWLLCGG